LISDSGELAMKCSCCNSNSVSRLNVAGRSVQVLGLPTLFERFYQKGISPEELLNVVRVYNAIPKEFEAEYRQAVTRAFAEYRPNDRGDRSITLGG
jgi:hypothetical protein